MSNLCRVAFVDDHPVLLDGIAVLFGRNPAFEVVATGNSADAALRIVEKHAPEILFLDLSMPGNVFGAIAEISRSQPNVKTVVFTAFSSVDSALRALDAGAMGFVLKGSTLTEMFEATEAVRHGELFITKQYASQVMGGLRNRARQDEINRAIKLSVREKQILEHLMHGRTNREIADSLLLSEKTVKHYMTNMMSKLHARNRVELVIEAQKSGQREQFAPARY
ncbi:response regulator transcription factor [Devosia sp. ZB163]|uniref:LuxR C-terminal-related transcriptional regulator n=1 Tax=Devosia sp. ZB163 TaxID=3025938 RepID=UPI00235F60B2|nr:response regulator transcription factor [Devosia sp. ZB163]MDC9825125.1 response regulator transcription factor [Devosia sp. ZB163]